MRALSLYKERFLRNLTPAARVAADFSRPAFIAAAFYLSARKVRIGNSRGLSHLGSRGLVMAQRCLLCGLQPGKSQSQARVAAAPILRVAGSHL